MVTPLVGSPLGEADTTLRREAETGPDGEPREAAAALRDPAAPLHDTTGGAMVSARERTGGAMASALSPQVREEAPAAGAAGHPSSEAELTIARLRSRVAALEAALERRSGELRLLQSCLCQRDLVQWTRMSAGLLPLPRLAHAPAFWQETLDLAVADVPETLAALWASLYPAAAPPRTAPR
jgi:hypothetical protein